MCCQEKLAKWPQPRESIPRHSPEQFCRHPSTFCHPSWWRRDLFRGSSPNIQPGPFPSPPIWYWWPFDVDCRQPLPSFLKFPRWGPIRWKTNSSICDSPRRNNPTRSFTTIRDCNFQWNCAQVEIKEMQRIAQVQSKYSRIVKQTS